MRFAVKLVQSRAYDAKAVKQSLMPKNSFPLTSSFSTQVIASQRMRDCLNLRDCKLKSLR